MDCPACDATQPEPVGTECARCGIVFAKVRVDHGQPSSGRVSSADDTEPATSPDRPQAARAALIGRGILYVCVLLWTWRFVSQPMGTAAMSSFLHGVNLVFHEAGHILFLPVGAFLTALGGSLMQLLVPMMCLVALVRQNRDASGGSLARWWMGENLLDLAPYIADAVALELVLLGGFTGREVEGHDWEAILGALGWLNHASVLGKTVHGLGVVVMVGASIWAPARSPPSGEAARAVRRRDARATARVEPGLRSPEVE